MAGMTFRPLGVLTAAAVAVAVAACGDSGPGGPPDNPAGSLPNADPPDGGMPTMPVVVDGGAGTHVLGPPQPPGGVLLDAHGGLHPFGGVKVVTSGAPSWPTQDMARALVVLSDGSGGWVCPVAG